MIKQVICLLAGIIQVGSALAADPPFPPAIEYKGLEFTPTELAEYRSIPRELSNGLRYYLGYSYLAQKVTDSCVGVPAFDAEYNMWGFQAQFLRFSKPLNPIALSVVERDAKEYSKYLSQKLAPQPIERRDIWCQIHGSSLVEQSIRVFKNVRYEEFSYNYDRWGVYMKGYIRGMP